MTGQPEPAATVGCFVRALRKDHQPHDWQPQPGMDAVRCPGYWVEVPPGALSALRGDPQAPGGGVAGRDGDSAAQAASGGSALREQIAGAMLRVFAPSRHLITPEEFRIVDELTTAVLAVILPHGKFLGDAHRESEAELMKALEALARVQALIEERPVAVGTHLLEEALDRPKEQP